MKNKILTAAILFLSSVNSQAGILANGDLSDWIHTPTGSAQDWTRTVSTAIRYTVEDQTGGMSAYLSPGYGGQAYDAEAMYTTQDSDNFYFAIVTGLSPDTTYFPAGDIAIKFGNGGYSYGVVVKSDSQNTQYNGGLGNQGQVYSAATWNVGLWGADENTHPTTVKTGHFVGNATVRYTTALFNGAPIAQLGQYAGTHYVIEASVPKSLFSPAELLSPYSAHWTMACANDAISVSGITRLDPGGNVPELAAFAMLSIALAGFLYVNRPSAWRYLGY